MMAATFDSRRRPPSRRGITLFEVMIALAIFLGSLAAIGQIVDVGSVAASRGRLHSEAVLRCETKLAEVIAGIEPMTAVSGQMFEDDPEWSWTLTIADGPYSDLLELTVDVIHQRSNGTSNAEFSLTRLIRDPQLFIDAAAVQEVE